MDIQQRIDSGRQFTDRLAVAVHIKTSVRCQTQFAGLPQHVVVIHQQVAATHIGDASVVVIHIGK